MISLIERKKIQNIKVSVTRSGDKLYVYLPDRFAGNRANIELVDQRCIIEMGSGTTLSKVSNSSKNQCYACFSGRQTELKDNGLLSKKYEVDGTVANGVVEFDLPEFKYRRPTRKSLAVAATINDIDRLKSLVKELGVVLEKTGAVLDLDSNKNIRIILEI